MPVADWEPIDWGRKFDIKQARRAKEAQAAMIRAEAARTQAGTEAVAQERLYGPGGLEQQKISDVARVRAGAEVTTAEARAGTVGLGREEFEFAKGYLEETGELPGRGRERDDVSLIKRIAGEEEEEGAARLGGSVKCPKGSRWNGKKCVPIM